MDNNELVICQGLTKNYGKKTALNNLNLTLGRGQFIGLLGPNGSGKTTTIKLLNGLLQPTSGSVLIDGQAPGTYTHSIISYLPDKNYLNDAMKVNDLILFFADFYTDFDRVKANDMLDSLGIDPLNRLKTLSKGNQEKVQLILTMSRKAQLYVLDEPIAGGRSGGTRLHSEHHSLELQRGRFRPAVHASHRGCGARARRGHFPQGRRDGSARHG